MKEEEKVEEIMNQILRIVLKNSSLDGLNGMMSALSHILYYGYHDPKTRRVMAQRVKDSLIDNITIIESRGGGLKKPGYPDEMRKKFVF